MRFAIVGAALFLAACGNINYVRDNYSGVQHVEYSPSGNPDNTYFVYDKPAEGRMILLDRSGSSMAAAAISGATLGTVDTSRSVAAFRQIADDWLKSQSRNCTTGTIDRLSRAIAEVRYTCQAGPTQ